MSNRRESGDRDTVAKRNRKKRTGPVILILVIIGLLVGASFSPILNVRGLQVQGNVKAKAEEIVNASGIEVGTHMLQIDKSAVSRVLTHTPYVSAVDIKRNPLTGMVFFVVTEGEILAYIAYQDVFLPIDAEGTVLAVEKAKSENLPTLLCGEVMDFSIGEKVDVDRPEEFLMMLAIAKHIHTEGMADRIANIQLSALGEMVMETHSGLKIKVGSLDQIEYKMTMLKEAFNNLMPDAQGSLDLTKAGQAIYNPQTGQAVQPSPTPEQQESRPDEPDTEPEETREDIPEETPDEEERAESDTQLDWDDWEESYDDQEPHVTDAIEEE